ncbi:hypothetical protein K492DRAFT_173947, partial [Lichtheimia hyalospora FSU 10163]
MATTTPVETSHTSAAISNNGSQGWLRVHGRVLPEFLITLTSYMAIGTLAVFTVTSLFCFFLAVSVCEDLIRASIPRRLLQYDYITVIEKVQVHLTHFVDWEQRKRDTWPFKYREMDRIHKVLVYLTDYLKDYIHHHRQTPTHTSN